MYLLILTLVFDFGRMGMGGGVAMHELATLNDCLRVGDEWVESVKAMRAHPEKSPGAIYQCIKVGAVVTVK